MREFVPGSEVSETRLLDRCERERRVIPTDSNAVRRRGAIIPRKGLCIPDWLPSIGELRGRNMVTIVWKRHPVTTFRAGLIAEVPSLEK